MFKIRQASLKDAEMLSHIGVATFVESYTNDIEGAAMMAHCTNEHSRAAYENYLRQEETACWIAVHSQTGAPVGYALNCKPDLPIDLKPNDIELKRIYVLSKYHGSGTAQTLLTHATAYAKAKHSARLLLGTYEENHRAMAFYIKYGFKTIGTRQFNVGGKIYDDIILAKPL